MLPRNIQQGGGGEDKSKQIIPHHDIFQRYESLLFVQRRNRIRLEGFTRERKGRIQDGKLSFIFRFAFEMTGKSVALSFFLLVLFIEVQDLHFPLFIGQAFLLKEQINSYQINEKFQRVD